MLKKLFTHSFIYAIAPQVSKVISILMLPILTPHLSKLDYGIYGIIMAYTIFITAFKDLGFAVLFTNAYFKSKYRWKYIWRLLYGHLIMWSFIYSCLLAVLLFFTIPKEVVSGNYIIIFCSFIIPALIFDNTSNIGNYYLRLNQKPFIITMIAILNSFIAIIINYFGIIYFKLGYLSWFITILVTSFITFCYYFYFVHYKLKLIPILRLRKKFIKPLLRISLPMIPDNYSSLLLSSADRVIMDFYKVNINSIGLYNMAYTFGNYFDSLGNSMGMAVSPFYSKLFLTPGLTAKENVRHLTFLLLTLFILIGFIVALWLKEIFAILIKNQELNKAYDIGIIVLMSYTYRPIYWAMGMKLSVEEKTSKLWQLSFSAGVLNVVLNIVFIPLYGILAAAYTTFISLIYLGFSGYYLPSFKGDRPSNFKPSFWIVFILLMTFIAFLTRDMFVIYKLYLTLIVLCFLAYYFFNNYATFKKINV